MPKMKSHSGAKKTFKVTGSGKIMHERAGKRHLLERKSSRLTRRLDQESAAKAPTAFAARSRVERRFFAACTPRFTLAIS